MEKVEVMETVGTSGVETSRKLSVADTLVQATRALRKHREWMKRRISSIVPEDSEIDTGKEKRAEWAVSKPIQEVSTSEEESSASGTGHFSAPPPFQARGVSAPQWWDLIQHKGNLAKVVPLPSLAEESQGSLPIESSEVLAQKTLPPQAWGSSSNVSQQAEHGGNRTISEDVSRFTHVEPQTSSTSAGRKHTKRHLPKSRVAPADVAGNSGKTDRTHQVDSATFLCHSAIPSNSTPPTVNVNAWGSVTTLDASLDGPSKILSSQRNLSDEITIVELEDPVFNTEISNEPKANECQESPSSLPEEPGTHTPQTAEGDHHTSDVDTESVHATGTESVKGLQSASSVKVVSVSPAPEAQRVTFAGHTKPKVDLAEVVQKVAAVSEERIPNLVSNVSTFASTGLSGSSYHDTAHDTPQAISQPVLPLARNRRAGVSSMVVTSSAYCPEGRPGIQERAGQSSSPTVHTNALEEDITHLGADGRLMPAVASVGDVGHESPQHAASSLAVSAETTLPTGSWHTSTLPTRSQHTSTLPTGSQHISTLPTGSQHISTLPNGSQHTSTLPTQSQNTSTLTTRPQHTPALPTRSQNTSTLTTRPQHTPTLPQHTSSPLATRTKVGETTSRSRGEALRELNLPPLREHQELYIGQCRLYIGQSKVCC